MANKPNRSHNDCIEVYINFDILVAGVQSHNDRNMFLSDDVPEVTREEIVDLDVDILQNDLEVGGASPSFPPTIDPAPSHNSSRKTNMAAPIDDDHEHWKRLFFSKPTNTKPTYVEEAINCRILSACCKETQGMYLCFDFNLY